MRTRLKAAVEAFLLRTGPAALSRWRLRSRGLVLAYHNIVPDGYAVRGDPSLHLFRSRFAEQLDILAEEEVQIVSLGELLHSSGVHSTTPGSGRRVAITFDDAYRGAVQDGVDELSRRGLPCTIFVAPGLLDGQVFWWDALATTDDGLDPRVREGALREATGRNQEVVAWARSQGLKIREVPEYSRSAGEDELGRAAAHKGVELASHTWSHANLARLDEAGCRRELSRAADWLRERHDVGAHWLSYPYGLYGSAAIRATTSLGYEAAFRIDGGWLPMSPHNSEAYRLPRLNVPAGLSRDGFALRLAGLLCS